MVDSTGVPTAIRNAGGTPAVIFDLIVVAVRSEQWPEAGAFRSRGRCYSWNRFAADPDHHSANDSAQYAVPIIGVSDRFLRSRGLHAVQTDLAIKLVLELFSAAGLRQIRDAIQLTSAKQSGRVSKVVQGFLDRFDLYESTIDRVIAFLQGRDATLVHRIAGRTYLPEGERFRSLDVFVGDDEGDDPMAWAFGALGVQDRAKHLATLYLSDLADVLKEPSIRGSNLSGTLNHSLPVSPHSIRWRKR